MQNDDTVRMRAFKNGGRWYLHWSTAFSALVIAISCVLFIGVPLLGRVAWSDETGRRIDEKIAIAVGPIQTEIGKLTMQMSQQSELLREQVSASLASNICRYNVRRNKEPDVEERLRLTTQMNEMRRNYAKFTGYEFDLKDC